MGKLGEAKDFGALLELLESKRELVVRLLALTADIGKVLEGEDFDKLERLLEERQQCMRILDTLSDRIDLGYLEVRPSLSADGGRIFGMREGEISGLMHTLLDEDRRVHTALQEAVRTVKQKSDDLMVQKRGFTAYAESQQVQSGSLITDKK
ncbi:MAG: hypothetical protein KGZ66_03020 [Selenomonadales bacterium]|nr:hypothetical protein [Selenomonadales bacterium]